MDTSKTLSARTLAEIAQEALDAQNAVNLSGVVHSFSRAVSTLWEQPEAIEQGTAWVNDHVICALYVDKLQSLSGTTRDYARDYASVRMLAGHGAPSSEESGSWEHVDADSVPDSDRLPSGALQGMPEGSKYHVG